MDDCALYRMIPQLQVLMYPVTSIGCPVIQPGCPASGAAQGCSARGLVSAYRGQLGYSPKGALNRSGDGDTLKV